MKGGAERGVGGMEEGREGGPKTERQKEEGKRGGARG